MGLSRAGGADHKLFKMLRKPALTALEEGGKGSEPQQDSLLEELAWEEGRVPIRWRFALVARYLTPDSAAADLATFQMVLKARNQISHGEPIEPTQLPIAEAQNLLSRYVELTLALEK